MAKRFDMKAWKRWITSRSEMLMFSLALVFLVCLAISIVIWVDVPGLQERAESVVAPENRDSAESLADKIYWLKRIVLTTMFIVWCIVLAEAVAHWLTRPWDRENRQHHAQGLLFVICPALRMCARSPEMNGRIWLPGMGWRRGGRRLQRQLERHFSVPMMVMALLIMPILIVEFFLKDQVAAYGWLRILLHIGTGVIWFAFAAEFILMVSIAEKKLEYCKEHWIDLAIVLLPILYFLRSLRLARASRLAKLMRFQQLSKLARAYRLRGTAIKAFRVLVLFDLTHRILRISDERRIEKLEIELAEMEKQSRLMRQKIAKLKIKAADEEDPTANPAVSDGHGPHEKQSAPTVPECR